MMECLLQISRMSRLFLMWSIIFNSVLLDESASELSSPSMNKPVFERTKKIRPAVSDAAIPSDSCVSAFEIDEHFIIRTEDSRREGAEFLNETSVPSEDDCMHWCCATSTCNVAVFDMKNKNSCYLFNCGVLKDFKCKFARHENYISAILKINSLTLDLSQWRTNSRHEEDLSKLKNLPTKITPTLLTSTIHPSTEKISVKTPEPTLPGPKCGRFEFECRTGNMCIAIYNACDKIPQCLDSSDEIGCPTVPPPPPPVPKLKFDDINIKHIQNVQPGYQANIPLDQNANNGIPVPVYNPKNPAYQPTYPDQKNFYNPQSNGYFPTNPWYRSDNPPYETVPQAARGRDNIKPNIYNSAPIISGDVYRPQDNLDYDVYNKYPNGIDPDYNNYYPDNGNVWVGTGEDVQGKRRTQQPITQGMQRPNGAVHEGTMHKSHSHGSSHAEAQPQNTNLKNTYKNGPEVNGKYLPSYQGWRPSSNPTLQNFNPEINNQGGDSSTRQMIPLSNQQTSPIINVGNPPPVDPSQVSINLEPIKDVNDYMPASSVVTTPRTLRILAQSVNDQISKEEENAVPSYTERSNGAALVLVLAFGLSITTILFIFVGCRVMHMRKRLRRSRSLSSSEADYLVNGMYL